MNAPVLKQKVRLLKTPFNPEAIGIIEQIRGFGSLQAIEVRTLSDQPGAKIRVAHVGQWESILEQEGGES